MEEKEQEVYVSKDNLARFATNVKAAIQNTKDAHFTYHNDRMKTEWIIEHGLGKVPSVTVVEDDTYAVIEAEVQVENENKIKVLFNRAISGKAYLN